MSVITIAVSEGSKDEDDVIPRFSEQKQFILPIACHFCLPVFIPAEKAATHHPARLSAFLCLRRLVPLTIRVNSGLCHLVKAAAE